MTDITETTQFSVEAASAAAPHKRGLGLGSIFLIASLILIGAIVAMMLMRQNQTQPTSGAAPDFTLETFDGQTVNLSDFRGQVVVLNFWASWCAPCAEEADDLEATWQKYRDQGVVFIGVAYADNGPRSLDFMQRYGVTYLNGPDLGTRISEKYNIRGVPETFIIDQDGHVVEFIYAAVTVPQISRIIDRVLVEGA
jgi:cytochrome c biogenesis protein CcmG, thiol:disulfide interchange protein DsbE